MLVLVGIGLVQAVSGTCRHRFAIAHRMLAAFRSSQWVNAPTVRLGAGLSARTSTGEVVSVGATDAQLHAALDAADADKWCSPCPSSSRQRSRQAVWR